MRGLRLRWLLTFGTSSSQLLGLTDHSNAGAVGGANPVGGYSKATCVGGEVEISGVKDPRVGGLLISSSSIEKGLFHDLQLLIGLMVLEQRPVDRWRLRDRFGSWK